MNQYFVSSSIQNLDRQHKFISRILNVKKNKKYVNTDIGTRDIFIHSNYISDDIGIYASPAKKIAASVPDSVLDMINFDYDKCFEDGNEQTSDGFIIGGIKYPYSAFDSVSLERCLDIKAENNNVVFESGNYYKFTGSDGKNHIMACCHNRTLKQPGSDLWRGVRDSTSQKATLFWDLLAFDSTYINLYFSDEEERKFLNDAGVEEGFFTVQVGCKKATHYYSKDGNTINTKEVYDFRYDSMTKSGVWFYRWLPGSVFKVDGKEYVLSENKTLDIPYGENIYDLEYPPKSEMIITD